MLNLWRKLRGESSVASRVSSRLRRAVFAGLEPLEPRQLLHGGFGGETGDGFGGGHFGGPPTGAPGGFGGQTIAFSLTPTVVQTGLDALAKADGLADPSSTQKVMLGNANGVETYTVTIDGTGTVSRLTVDQLGDPVTAPTHSTTTWATLDGTAAGSDSAAAAEISTIASALKLTAPTSTTTVNLSNTSAGVVTYSVNLNNSSATTTSTTYWHGFGTTITVDAAGNPVGNQQLLFSVFSTAIQNALNKNAPTGATALASTSTQNVDVRTTDGVTTYSVIFTATGKQTTVTVDSAGTLTSLPTQTTTTFSTLSSKLQTELQTLATADGVAATIAGTQSINVLTETTGTIIYSATLNATGTGSSGDSYNFDVTIAVDSSGNPTTLPLGGGGFGIGGSGFGDPGNQGDCSGGTPTQNSSAGSTTSNSSSASISVSAGAGATPAALTVATTSALQHSYFARLLADGDFALASIGGYLAEFAAVSTASLADGVKLGTDILKLAGDARSLSAAQRKIFAADEKSVAAAVKATKSTLSPLEATLKSDTVKWAKTLESDHAAIKRDRNNSTELAAAKAQLTTDEASALAAVVQDASTIVTAVNTNAGVITAQQKLATDLPAIGSDESAIKAEQTQLISDLQA